MKYQKNILKSHVCEFFSYIKWGTYYESDTGGKG